MSSYYYIYCILPPRRRHSSKRSEIAVLKYLTFGTKISNARLILQGALRFWNYNKNFLEAAKGVRHARVVYRGVEVWAGDETGADAYCYISSVLILLYI